MEKKDYPYFDREIRNKLEHETSVVNNRMMWHHAVQIALLIGYYHIYVSGKDVMSGPVWILTAFSVFGILLALSAIYSLWISDKARAFILMHWNRYLAEIGCDSDMFPPVSGDPLSCIRKCKESDATYRDMHLKKRDILFSKIPNMFMLYKFIPILFLLLWCFCLIISFSLSYYNGNF